VFNPAHKILHPFLLLCMFNMSEAVPAQEVTEEALERWFEDDDAPEPYQNQSGGKALEFIAPITDRQIPYSHTRLRFSAHSMAFGWVAITQCHYGLDPVPDAEVVYRFEQMRSLLITEVHNIAEARVVGQSVQLRDVSKGGRLCVEMEAMILKQDKDGHYRLRYGPFMRKFLDGYFPLHVLLEVNYPSELLELDTVTPPATEGIMLKQQNGWLALDAWVRGILVIELYFSRVQ